MSSICDSDFVQVIGKKGGERIKMVIISVIFSHQNDEKVKCLCRRRVDSLEYIRIIVIQKMLVHLYDFTELQFTAFDVAVIDAVL